MKTGGIHLPFLFRKGTTTLQLQRFGIFQFRGFSNSETELRDAKKCMISYRRHTSLIGEKKTKPCSNTTIRSLHGFLSAHAEQGVLE